ncbi:gap junction delta-3 protein-like [Megalops cyprinoides]|uniref:gap junction delta-3 protein-like n=1 Tax=Megalops cyprinoides TaxID=118141 RepID=UPI0018641CE6|nr:gap junction delta-3 protein-like [Megalops cyprinoides]
MGEWGFLGGLFDTLQAQSPMLGRFWLLIMLVFRILILGTVATDLFEDEQEEFVCNTLQPGCKQVCYDEAFPISQYRFWVFHIVLISTPALVYLVYAMHIRSKDGERRGRGRGRGQGQDPERHLRRLYIINVAFRLLAEIGFIVGQWWLYGFRVEDHFPCRRFPCPHTVDCFPSRPMEKTVFLCFYFSVGVLSAGASVVELVHMIYKWLFGGRREWPEHSYNSENQHNLAREEEKALRAMRDQLSKSSQDSIRLKTGLVRSISSKSSRVGHKTSRCKGATPPIAV